MDLPDSGIIEQDEMMRCWSDLPEHVVECILTKIDDPTDLLNFASVCKRWYSKSVQKYQRLPGNLPIQRVSPKASPLPMLLVPFSNDPNRRPYLYSIINKRTYNCFSESLFQNKWIPGSTGGWLVTVDTKDKSINLLNPLTAEQIALPGLSTFDKPVGKVFRHEVDKAWYVEKAIVIFDASGKPENSVIVAIVTTQRRLCFCRVGDNKWTNVESSPISICDVISIKGILWAVDRKGRLFAIVIGRRHTKVTLIVGLPHLPGYTGDNYLVESCGGLLMVYRHTVLVDEDDNEARTDRFQVFALVKSASKYQSEYALENNKSRRKMKGVQYEWINVESVGKQMIFLGYNHSLALDPCAYPGCRGNRIYYADDLFDTDMNRFFLNEDHKSHDIGVYDLQSKRVEFLEGLGASSSYHALWLSPNG